MSPLMIKCDYIPHVQSLSFLQIFVSTMPLLTEQELSQLGIERMGDRALLRKRCRESTQSKISMKIASAMGCLFGATSHLFLVHHQHEPLEQ